MRSSDRINILFTTVFTDTYHRCFYPRNEKETYTTYFREIERFCNAYKLSFLLLFYLEVTRYCSERTKCCAAACRHKMKYYVLWPKCNILRAIFDTYSFTLSPGQGSLHGREKIVECVGHYNIVVDRYNQRY